jgi:UDP-glucose 4-epimerase
MVDEFLALAYWKQGDLPVVVARLFNTVGPRQTGQYGMVLPRFVVQALRGEPITVYGDGTQQRCFGHVQDVVAGLVGLMDCDSAAGQVFNVGAEEEVSIYDLACRIREMTDSPSEIVFVPYEQAYEEGFEDMPRRIPDLTKIRGAIGYEPKRDLEQIIRDVIAGKEGREAPLLRQR